MSQEVRAFQFVPGCGCDREMIIRNIYPYQNMTLSAAESPHTGERVDVVLDVKQRLLNQRPTSEDSLQRGCNVQTH